MNTFAAGIVFALLLLASAILLRSFPTQSGEGPRRTKNVVVGVLVAASLLSIVVTLTSPFVHALPNPVVAFVERVLPQQPKSLHHPFRYPPTMGQIK
jgi:hypothetical protein